MRFAAIATTVATVLVMPLALAANAPSMSGSAFLSAARCAGYESVTPGQDSQGWTQATLNAEARRQPAAVAASAQTEIDAIAEQAAAAKTPEDRANLRLARDMVCAAAPGQVAGRAVAGATS